MLVPVQPSPILVATLAHLATSGWPVALVCEPENGPYLEVRPWNDSPRSLRIWAGDDVLWGQLRNEDRIAPLRDYLDTARRQAMASGVLGLLEGAEESLLGFTAGSMTNLLDRPGLDWAQVWAEGSQLHREVVSKVSAANERGELTVDEDGWIHCQTRVNVSASGLDFATFSAVLENILAVSDAYRLALRLALFGGWSEARALTRPQS